MGLTVHCETIKSEVLHDQLGTDICRINVVKWEASAVASILLFAIIIYMMLKWKYRCHKTLLTFHNLRAAVALLLLAINTIELAKALLPVPDNINVGGGGGKGAGAEAAAAVDNVNGQHSANKGNGSQSNLPQPASVESETDAIVVVLGTSSILANALTAIILTLMLMWYHRIVEIKKSLEFLYVGSTLTVLIFILRIYEFAEIIYFESVMELESIIHGTSAICLLFLAAIDGFTVYKERYRPDYLEDYEKIGYKHTLATFYSKACFWWLTPLLWFGYKEPLELEDLGQMRVEDSARAHYDRFLLIYKTAKVKNSDKPPSLWLCYLKNSWRMFTLGGLLKLFGDLFAVIGPLAIQQIVQYIEIMYGIHYNDSSSNNDNNSGSNNNALKHMNTTGGNVGAGTGNLGNIIRNSIRTPHTISIRAIAQRTLDAVAAVAATTTTSPRTVAKDSLLLLPTTNVTSNKSYDNFDNNEYRNINTDVYNQIANSIDYNASSASYYGSFSTSSSPSSDDIYGSSLSSGYEVKIYYATWLDLLSNGWCVAWLVLLAALAQGALSQASTHILNMTGIRIKTSLQGLIYRKTLLLNSACIDTATTTSPAFPNATVNLKLAQNGQVTATGNASKPENGVNTNCSNRQASNGKHGEETDVTKSTGNGMNNNNDVKSNDNSLNDIGAITNLMSEDTLNIMSFFWIAHYVWAIPLKIAIVMYLLYLKLGISAVIGSFVCILTMTPLQFLIGKAMSSNAEIMAKYTDNRLKKLHDCFVGIKLIKLNAWDNVFIKKINEARQKELKYLNKDSVYWTMMTILTHISSVLITFVTLAVYVKRESGSEITASRLFSALALFQQLTVPLLIFPITVPIILSAIVSTKRLEKFLSTNEIQKQFEGIRNMARILSKSDASLDMYEVKSQSLPANITLKTVSEQAKQAEKPNERPNIKIFIPEKPAPLANSEPQTPLLLNEFKGNLEFPLDHKKLSSNARKELLRNTPYVVIRPRKNLSTITPHQHYQQASQPGSQQPQKSGNTNLPNVHHRHSKTDSWHRDSLLLKMPDDIAVSVKNCKFSWNPQRLTQILYVRDFAVPRGKLTMIVGKNGSGKSSLLSALLMEMPLISGDMIWNKTSTIAFVPQQPWLLNASIRENILFGESFRPKRYDFVLDACALKPDIDLMPAGDLTAIGERGINLSGGQRQRVAIARALYSSANVVIMDDPLSSLDNEVARHIFEQSIKKMLLKANRTVILVTQQLNLLQQAHNLIVLKDGCLQASGSYKDIAATHPHIIAKWNSIIAKANEREQQNNTNDSNALGRTARERWKLFKNVSKLGLQRIAAASAASATATSSNLHTNAGDNNSSTDAVGTETEINTTSMENILAADDGEEEYDIMPATSSMNSTTSFKLSRTPSNIYRHLIYDVPLPLDECQSENVIMRRRRRTASRGESGFRRPSSRASSRLSTISNTPTELRRSLLTDSYGSAVSYMTNVSSNYSEHPASRTQSWTPTNPDKKQHQTLSKNISAPPTFDATEGKDEADVVANSVADLDVEKESSGFSGFQQFLRRMSMRKSYKTKTAAPAQHCRPCSGDMAIISISEESSGIAASSIPSIELSSVATDAETETESWIAGIENEESIQDANIDYKTLLANSESHMAKTCASSAIIADTDTADTIASTTTTATTTVMDKSISSTTSSAATQHAPTATPTATISYDVERKYGKIPAEIYLLYLRASGLTICLIFFITALIWQALRVYTDVWLQQWTDDNTNINNMNNPQQQQLLHNAATHTITSANISGMQQMSSGSGGLSRTYYATAKLSRTATTILQTSSAQNEFGFHDGGNDGDHHYTPMEREVTYYFHIYAVISSVCIVMAMISTPAGQWAGCKARRNLHDKLLHSIMHKSLHFFRITPLGRIMNRFSNDMAIIDKKIAATSQRLLQFTLLCLCAILINVIITPWFMVVTVPVCLAYYVIQKFYRCSSRELQRIENATNTPVISHLSETIQGVTTIRAYNQESRFTEILFRRLEENTIAFTILNTSNRWLGISLDYLGGVIVFVAIVTALLAATIACNNHNNSGSNKMMATAAANSSATATVRTMLALAPSPSLVGLAINYTLLMPIYLNWVVKLLADMEMYIGSVERIAYYAESNDEPTGKKEMMAEEETATILSSHDMTNISNMNNNKDLLTKVSAVATTTEQQPQDVGVAVVVAVQENPATSAEKVCNNDKLFGLSEISNTAAASVTTSNDNNVDMIAPKTSSSSSNKYKKQLDDNKTNIVAAATDDDDDNHHPARHITNDGHIAVTTKTLSNRQTSDDNIEDNFAALVDKTSSTTSSDTTPASTATTTTAKATIMPTTWPSSSSFGLSSSSNNINVASGGSTSKSSKHLERNDAERKASIRRLAKNKKQYKTVAISWPQRGDISFENVSLRYEGQHVDVIKNLNLKIPAGQRIGICGRTGSGKSSLALSLFGVLQVSNGCIRIDDNDITDIHPDEIRTRLSIIPQDVHLFNMTIRENLDPSGYYSDLELWNCLELAQLKDFVNTKMPQGLETEIMDGGLNLSLGHRQLFCLARAILRGSVCLVLDEATSALDLSTEKALLAAAHKSFQGRTIITIAHRLSTILDYDRVIVLDKGRIIEDGSPRELRNKPDGIFAAYLKSGRPLSALSTDTGIQSV